MAHERIKSYTPVACAFHESLEFAVLRRQQLELVWLTEAGELSERALPIDVATRGGAEWLTVARIDGRQEDIRLDHIVAARVA